MADNLLEMAVRQLGSSGLSALDSALDIPEGKGESAVNAGMATIIAGMLKRGTNRSGPGSLLNIVTGGSELDLSSASEAFKDPAGMSKLQDSGSGMLDTIFGNKLDHIAEAFSSSLGLDKDTGSRLLKVIATITMALLGKQAKSKGLDMGDLDALLLEQKPFIRDELPGDMLQELGVHSFEQLGEGARVFSRGHAEPQAARKPAERKPGGFGKWFWPLLIALAALYALNMCAKREKLEDKPGEVLLEEESVIVEAAPDGTATPPDGTAAAPTTGEAMDFASSFREYLASAARDPNREFPLTIEFAKDSAEVTSTPVPDVAALVTILQENPGVTIAIEGHTSGEGDEAANQQLSQERADAVMQMLVDQGIDADRVTAAGMGSAKPIADESTEEGKQKNRRISVRVVTFE